MKKKFLYILILIAITGVFGTNLVVQAEIPYSPFPTNTPNPTPTQNTTLAQPTPAKSVTEYKYLAPLPDESGAQEPTIDLSDGSISKYINRIITLVIGLAAVLAVVMIVMGGIQYMGNELLSSKEEGRSRINNALLGLALAMGAYALLNTINPDLLNGDMKIDPVKVTIEINDSVPQTPINGKYKNGTVEVAENTRLTGTPTPLPLGVSLNNGWTQCTYVGQKNCTSTIGLKMDNIWTIKNGCGCALTITGGTEWWAHGASGSTTHQVGNGTVDLRVTSELTKYFIGNTTPKINTWYEVPTGYAYFEGDHWHYNPTGKH